MGRKQHSNRRRAFLKEEQGYLLMSTLFFLLLSGIFSQSLIKISGYHITQYRQMATAYKTKAALNMSEGVLKEYIVESGELPKTGRIKTSAGEVQVKKEKSDKYQLTMTLKNNLQVSKEMRISPDKTTEETKPEEKELPTAKQTIPD